MAWAKAQRTVKTFLPSLATAAGSIRTTVMGNLSRGWATKATCPAVLLRISWTSRSLISASGFFGLAQVAVVFGQSGSLFQLQVSGVQAQKRGASLHRITGPDWHLANVAVKRGRQVRDIITAHHEGTLDPIGKNGQQQEHQH